MERRLRHDDRLNNLQRSNRSACAESVELRVRQFAGEGGEPSGTNPMRFFPRFVWAAVITLFAIPFDTATLRAQEASKSEVIYDSFGRAVQARQLMPDNTWSVRATTYDSSGRTKTVSEAVTDGQVPKKTTYEYDLFGRPTRIHPPDDDLLPSTDHADDTRLSYTGSRLRTRTNNVATGATTETAATFTEEYDAQGRLWKVTEPNATFTQYGYDVGGRLSSVAMTAGGVTQNRTFLYDQRGFLLSETHPEKGVNGNGSVTYVEYDGGGHLLRKREGGENEEFDLLFTYDEAERLTQIRERRYSKLVSGALITCLDGEAGCEQRLLKEFVYSQASTGSSRGKLTTAKRHNWQDAYGLDVVVSETYSYGGINGELTERLTQKSCVPACSDNEQFSQTFDYDSLGREQTTNYPRCQHAGCVNTDPARPVTSSYTKGFLTDVNGYTTSATTLPGIGYHPNGMVARVAHSNGVTVTQANDPEGIARPLSISTSGVGSGLNWNSGNYGYDGSGNIKTIGIGDTYVYDALSRVTEGSASQKAAGVKQSQTFDPFGNLTSMTTADGITTTNTIAVSNQTNRLTGESYDAMGNMLSWSSAPGGALRFSYDAFGMVKVLQSGTAPSYGKNWMYIYTPDDERIWSYNAVIAESTWRIRSLGQQVLREYKNGGGAGWRWTTDYIWRDDALLAAESPNLTRHFHLDHLGTPRLVTNGSGVRLSLHQYFPFGDEATSTANQSEPLRFTGHERDFNGSTISDNTDQLDYMHARYYSGVLGRFLSPDAVLGTAEEPQTWNRYSYIYNNPVNDRDPDGNCPTTHCETTTVTGTVPTVRLIPGVDGALYAEALYDFFAWSQKQGNWIGARMERGIVALQQSTGSNCHGQECVDEFMFIASAFGGGGARAAGPLFRITNLRLLKGRILRGNVTQRGGVAAARQQFERLTGRPPRGTVDQAKLPDGTTVRFREFGSGGAKVEINDSRVGTYQKTTFRN